MRWASASGLVLWSSCVGLDVQIHLCSQVRSQGYLFQILFDQLWLRLAPSAEPWVSAVVRVFVCFGWFWQGSCIHIQVACRVPMCFSRLRKVYIACWHCGSESGCPACSTSNCRHPVYDTAFGCQVFGRALAIATFCCSRSSRGLVASAAADTATTWSYHPGPSDTDVSGPHLLREELRANITCGWARHNGQSSFKSDRREACSCGARVRRELKDVRTRWASGNTIFCHDSATASKLSIVEAGSVSYQAIQWSGVCA